MSDLPVSSGDEIEILVQSEDAQSVALPLEIGPDEHGDVVSAEMVKSLKAELELRALRFLPIERWLESDAHRIFVVPKEYSVLPDFPDNIDPTRVKLEYVAPELEAQVLEADAQAAMQKMAEVARKKLEGEFKALYVGPAERAQIYQFGDPYHVLDDWSPALALPPGMVSGLPTSASWANDAFRACNAQLSAMEQSFLGVGEVLSWWAEIVIPQIHQVLSLCADDLVASLRPIMQSYNSFDWSFLLDDDERKQAFKAYATRLNCGRRRSPKKLGYKRLNRAQRNAAYWAWIARPDIVG